MNATTVEVTVEQAKIFEQHQEYRARVNKRNKRPDVKARYGERKADIRAGRRQVSHRPVVPDEAFDKLLETLSKETLQHIAGVLEGDGTTCYARGQKTPLIGFSNNDKPLLQYIKDTLQIPTKISGPDKGSCYQLSVSRQEHVQSLLRVLSPYFCCSLEIEKTQRVFDECGYDIDFELSEHEPTIPWFVGFGFDTEGNVDPRTYQLVTTQKDRRPLEKLQRLFNSGIVKEETDEEKGWTWYTVTWSGESFRKLISHILKYSKHQEKRDMLIAVLYFLAKVNPDGVWGEFYQQLKKDSLL